MPEQKLTWEQKIRYEINALIYAHSSGTEITAEEKEGIIIAIKEAMRPELEKAFDSNGQFGNTPDFETWYQNTYLK